MSVTPGSLPSCPPLPSTGIALWLGWLACKIKAASIRTYMFGIHRWHLELNLPSPIQGNEFVWATWRGIKRFQGQTAAEIGNAPAHREPITAGILAQIQKRLNLRARSQATRWAAYTMGTFALLRISEFTVPNDYAPSDINFKPLVLRWRNIEWYNQDGKRIIMIDGSFPEEPTEYRLLLPASKTDPFRKSVTIRVFTPMAVEALRNLAELVGQNMGYNDPIFINGVTRCPYTRSQLIDALRRDLENCGLQSSRYNGHSFRRGGAQTLAEAGISEDVIKLMGRWLSDAYLLYIKTPPEVIRAAGLAMEPDRLV